MNLTSEHVQDALRSVQDPDLKKDLITLRMVKDVQVSGGRIGITVELTTPACPMKDRIRADIEHAVQQKAAEVGASVDVVEIEFTAEVRSARSQPPSEGEGLPGVSHVIAVGAGKGGVGKSTVSVAVAVALGRMGAKVGLLDGDIYGPSIPTMMGLADHKPRMRDEKTLLPFEAHGIKTVSIGKLVPADKALIWRGPMAHGAFRQLLTQTEWGELDYLIVDLPPGTGDVPLSLCQMIPLSGAVVVCTPQKVAQDDALRAVRMFEQLGVEVLGIVENMSYFIGDDGKEYDIFGRGGAESLASTLGVEFLGRLPINMDLRANCDQGTPLRNWESHPTLGREIDALAHRLAQQISIATRRGAYVQPTLSVS